MNFKKIAIALTVSFVSIGYLAQGKTPTSKYSSLVQAIYDRDTTAAAKAIANGANVNERISGMQPVIQAAANFGNIEIVRMLLEKGADINAVNSEGDNIMTMWPGCTGEVTEMVRMFLKAGVDISFLSPSGSSALTRFAGTYDVKNEAGITKSLIAAGADVKRDGGRALISAASP